MVISFYCHSTGVPLSHTSSVAQPLPVPSRICGFRCRIPYYERQRGSRGLHEALSWLFNPYKQSREPQDGKFATTMCVI